MSDTNPLPAAQLLALADAAVSDERFIDGTYLDAVAAYRAARAASPVTLEERLLIDEWKKSEGRPTVEWIRAVDACYEHARRLAGEGGA